MSQIDDRGFAAAPPDFTAERLAEIARDHYGISGELTSLFSERDQNARIAGLVLKVANVDEDPEVLHLQHAALAHLEATAPSLGVPRLVRTRDAADTASVHGVQGVHLVRCITYLPGRSLASVPRTPELERELGVLMGTVSAGLRGFGHAARIATASCGTSMRHNGCGRGWPTSRTTSVTWSPGLSISTSDPCCRGWRNSGRRWCTATRTTTTCS